MSSQERVFCHPCGARWNRNEHGLICPNCESEFVEIQEHDDQPAVSPEPTFDFNDFFLSPGGQEQFFAHQPQNQQRNPQHNPPPLGGGGLLGLLQTLATGMQNPPPPPQQSNRTNTRTYAFSTPTGNTRITYSTATFGAASGHRDMNATPHFPMDTPFGHPFHVPGNPPDPQAAGVPGLPGLLNMIFGGATMGRTGDHVWSEEEMQRIISQLMEQHGRNAPGPAPADAIETLPKKEVDEEMLADGKAECTICMDEVALGDVVTELYCQHWFHTPCITAWLQEHDTCPHCRKSIQQAREEAATRATAPSSSQPRSRDAPALSPRRSSRHHRDPSIERPRSRSRDTAGQGSSRGFADRVRGLWKGPH